MDWLIGLIKPHLGGIFAFLAVAVGGLIAVFQAKRSGAKEQRQKDTIATQAKTIQNMKEREAVDTAVAATAPSPNQEVTKNDGQVNKAGDDSRIVDGTGDSLRDKWTRD